MDSLYSLHLSFRLLFRNYYVLGYDICFPSCLYFIFTRIKKLLSIKFYSYLSFICLPITDFFSHILL